MRQPQYVVRCTNLACGLASHRCPDDEGHLAACSSCGSPVKRTSVLADRRAAKAQADLAQFAHVEIHGYGHGV